MNIILLKLAFRNLFYYPKNTFILLFSVIFGVSLGLLGVSIINGLVIQRQIEKMDTSLAHLKINHLDYQNDKQSIFYINQTENIIKKIKKEIDIQAITKRINIRGLILNGTQNLAVDIYGVDILNEKKVLQLSTYIRKGVYLSEKDKPQIVIGKALAQKLQKKINDTLQIQTTNIAQKNSILKVKIVGIYEVGQEQFSKTHIFLPFDFLEQYIFLEKKQDFSHQILIKIKKKEQANHIKKQIKSLFVTQKIDLQISTWIENAPDLAYWYLILDVFFFIFLGLIFFALGIALFNLMAMSVWSRKEELYRLYVLGIAQKKVQLMIIFETILLLIVALPLSFLICYGTIFYFQTYGLDVSLWNEAMSVWGYHSKIYPFLSVQYYFFTFFLAFLTALLAGFLVSRNIF
ncbi:MAG: FtsX-like permease family protein [Bacteroidetes bacterium]|nr:MAG: FtsX-like permease family protein [Bacteroidota bacterium]TAG93773.1 MAG: FtsX-like permease family protein [Bacteroidota bacterium]